MACLLFTPDGLEEQWTLVGDEGWFDLEGLRHSLNVTGPAVEVDPVMFCGKLYGSSSPTTT